MALANKPLTANLTEVEATQISRSVWGNSAKRKPRKIVENNRMTVQADIFLEGSLGGLGPPTQLRDEFYLCGPVVHSVAARNAKCNWIVDQLDGGFLRFVDVSGATVATLGFASPAFGDAVDGTATAFALTHDDSAIGGTIVAAILANSAGDEVARCSVTQIGLGVDIELSSVNCAPTQPLEISSLTYRVAP